MSRLPIPGQDKGTWGGILNDYLGQSHNSDGSLKPIPQITVTDLTTNLASKANTTDLAPIATTGSYTDLTSKPTIPAPTTDASQLTTGTLDDARLPVTSNATAVAAATSTANAALPTASIPTAVAGEVTDPASPTGVALSATYARPTGARVTVLGDSIDASPTGWFMWLTTIGKLPVCRNAGVLGNTTAMMLARLPAELVYAPNILIIGGATNDFKAGTPEAATRANVEAIVAACLSAGVKPVLRTTPPCDNAGYTPLDTVELLRQAVLHYNSWLKDYGARNGIPVLDLYSGLVDPVTGGYVTGYTSDGYHPLEAASQLAAQALITTGLPSLFRSEFNYATTGTDSTNLFPNGSCATGGGGFAYSWTKALVTPTLIDDPAIVGRWQKAAGTTTGIGVISCVAPGTGFSVGDQVAICGRVKSSGTGGTAEIIFQFTGGGTEIHLAYDTAQPLDGSFSFEQIIPAGTTQITFNAKTIGVIGEWVQISGLAGRNLTRLRA